MKTQIEQTVIIHLAPDEAVWLKELLDHPPRDPKEPIDLQRNRLRLRAMLFEALEALNY